MKFRNSWTGNWKNAFRGLRHPYESYDKADSYFGIAVNGNDFNFNNKLNKAIQSYVDNWQDERYDPNKADIRDYFYTNGILSEEGAKFNYALIGAKDMDLAKRMIKAGSPNDKFLRQIFVSVDITGPLYWWKEMDTYKVGTTANSTSTMHKLASTPITIDCFETDDYDKYYTQVGAITSPKISIIRDNKNIEEHNDWAFDIDQFPITALIPYLEKLRQKYLETKDMRYWKELIRWLPESWLQTRTWTADYAVLRNIIHWRKGHKLHEWERFINWCQTLPYEEELLFFEN